MMPSMPEMEFSPLRNREWPQEGMFQHLGMGPKFRRTAGENGIHFGDLQPDLRQYLFRRQVSWAGDWRSLHPIGEISEIEHHQRRCALFPGLALAENAGFEHSRESFGCSGIGEVQMLEYFRR